MRRKYIAQEENDMRDDKEENGNTRGFCSWNETQYTFVFTRRVLTIIKTKQ